MNLLQCNILPHLGAKTNAFFAKSLLLNGNKFNGYLKNDNMARTAAALVQLDGKFNQFDRRHEILATLTHSRQTFVNTYSYNFKRPLVDIDTFTPGSVAYPDWNGVGFSQGEIRRRYTDWGVSLGTTLGTD